MMRRLADLPILVLLLGITAAAMYVPALHALTLRDHVTARAFLYSGTLLLILSGFLGMAMVNRPAGGLARRQLGALVGAFSLLPLAMALPVYQSLAAVSLFDAWFEMLSSLTTTGATLFDGRLPPSVHLWRAMVAWYGGFITLVAAVSILEPMNMGGFELLRGGTPGSPVATRVVDPTDRILRHARIILPYYGAATAVLAVALILAGDPALVAVSHALATFSTSGVSPLAEGVAGAPSGVAGEMLILLCLIPALSRRAIPVDSPRGHLRRWLGDAELRIGLGIVAAATLFLLARPLAVTIERSTGGGLADAVPAAWGALFTALSFMVTAGQQSQNWGAVSGWSGMGAPGIILLGLAIFGGGVATTAGGVKLLRVQVLSLHAMRETERLVHPSSIGSARIMPRAQRRSGAFIAWVFFMVFAIGIAVLAGLLTLTGQGFEPAVVLAVAALTNTGPLATLAGAEPIAYAGLNDAARAVLALAMVVGRVEVLAILALANPAIWSD